MKIKTSLFAWIIPSILLLAACEENKPTQRPDQPVQVISVLQVDLPIYQEFVGSIYGYKDIPIRARVEGFLESMDFKEGLPVKKGQLLYTIDAQPFQAEVAAANSKVAEAETKLVNAENELARYKPLADSKAVSQSDVDAAQATRDAAEANLHAVEANLDMALINLSYATMRSPINGIIGRTSARVGEYVGKDPNPVILNTVSRLDTIRVQFFLSESQYLAMIRDFLARDSVAGSVKRKKQDLHLTLSDGSVYNHVGHVDFIDRNINESTGAILVQASFPNPERILRPGLYAKIKLMSSYDKQTFVVPQRSIIETQGQYSVMILTDSNVIQSRQVKVGAKFNGNWQVTEGLKKGELIVYEGLQKVRTGVKVAPETVPFSLDLK